VSECTRERACWRRPGTSSERKRKHKHARARQRERRREQERERDGDGEREREGERERGRERERERETCRHLLHAFPALGKRLLLRFSRERLKLGDDQTNARLHTCVRVHVCV